MEVAPSASSRTGPASVPTRCNANALPTTLGISATIPADGQEQAQNPITGAAMHPMNAAAAVRALHRGQRRTVHQPPAHAQHNGNQGTQDQGEPNGIRQRRPGEDSQGGFIQAPEGLHNARHAAPNEADHRGANVHPLQDQKNAQSNDREPDHLEAILPQGEAQAPKPTVKFRRFAHVCSTEGRGAGTAPGNAPVDPARQRATVLTEEALRGNVRAMPPTACWPTTKPTRSAAPAQRPATGSTRPSLPAHPEEAAPHESARRPPLPRAQRTYSGRH